MKNDFLTIPDAPNYEINSKLIVRNKTTGKILKPKLGKYVRMSVNNKFVCGTLKNLYANAKDRQEWQSVPSLNGTYELTKKGSLRKTSTKILIKRCRDKSGYNVCLNGKRIFVTIKSLLWEVFGVILKTRPTSILVTIIHDRLSWKFPSITQAAKFLAPKLFLGVPAVRYHMTNRRPNICGWKIYYKDPDALADV